MHIKDWLKYLRRDSVAYEGLILPAVHLRTGGPQFRENSYFVQSGKQEVNRLREHFDLSSASVLLDVGCGFGRLAIGLTHTVDELSYIGIDVNKTAISWCQKHITSRYPNFRFIYLDLQNKRYNPDGKPIDIQFKLPLESSTINVAYLYSVFSHMLQNDVRHYLKELNRVLVANGTVFFTAFSEYNVPPESVNPPGYQDIEWKDDLHCVRFNHDFLLSIINGSGFLLEEFEHGNETEGQSAFYLTKI